MLPRIANDSKSTQTIGNRGLCFPTSLAGVVRKICHNSSPVFLPGTAPHLEASPTALAVGLRLCGAIGISSKRPEGLGVKAGNKEEAAIPETFVCDRFSLIFSFQRCRVYLIQLKASMGMLEFPQIVQIVPICVAAGFSLSATGARFELAEFKVLPD